MLSEKENGLSIFIRASIDSLFQKVKAITSQFRWVVVNRKLVPDHYELKVKVILLNQSWSW